MLYWNGGTAAKDLVISPPDTEIQTGTKAASLSSASSPDLGGLWIHLGSDTDPLTGADGSLVDGDELIYVIARHRLASGSSDAGVVGTLMTNLGVEVALQEQGLRLVRAQVGDRYVKELMEAEGWHLCTRDEFLARGGLTTPAPSRAWLASLSSRCRAT